MCWNNHFKCLYLVFIGLRGQKTKRKWVAGKKQSITNQIKSVQEAARKRSVCIWKSDGSTSLLFSGLQMGFFKRVRPPQEEREREQLQPHENGEGTSEA